MKKLAVIASLMISAPGAVVWACPNMDHDQAPKTADKDKAAPAPTADKAKDTAKPADAAAAKKDQDKDKKTGDKVSSK